MQGSISKSQWPLLAAYLILLQACVATFHLSNNAKQLRSKLSEDKALAIVGDAVAGKPGSSLGAHLAYVPNSLFGLPIATRVFADRVEFATSGPEVNTSFEPPAGCLVPSGELVSIGDYVSTICWHHIRLRRLRRIIVRWVEAAPPDPDGYSVLIGEYYEVQIGLHVAREELDPLMAALTFLSPNAALLE